MYNCHIKYWGFIMTIKRVALIMIMAVMILNLSACNTITSENEKINIVCSVFPLYDWVNIITAGCDAVVNELILKDGTDFHNFQPSAKDIINITSSNVMICIGGESELWLDELNYDGIKVSLIESDQHNEEHHNEEHHNHTVDEHIWLSLKNAIEACRSITNVLCNVDSTNAELYTTNCEKYISQLKELDERYNSTVNSASLNKVVVPDRNPFAYLAEDYNLECYAAFSGCYAEAEASFETIISLANKLNEHKNKYVIVTETSDNSLANAVIEASQTRTQQILVFNTLQSVTKEEINSGMTYYKVMENNLEVLNRALNNL